MANVKSRLKAPKSASTKTKKKGRGKIKKSLAGPKKSKLLKNYKECEVVMKRPSNQKVMTPDEKVQFILANGNKLKEKFIAKPPANCKHKPSEPQTIYKKKEDSDLPLMTKSGHLKKKTKCNMKLVDSILKNELMINDSGKTKNSNNKPHSSFPPSLPISVNNNNDNEITDQNSTFGDFSDDGSESDFKLSGDHSDTSDDISEDSNCSKDSIEKTARKNKGNKVTKKKKLKPIKKKPRPKHIKLKNGVVLRLAYFECDHCKKTFNRKCSLRRHMFMHLGIKPYNCKRCPQEFISPYNKQVHKERFHSSSTEDTGLFVCNYCEKPFLVKENLKIHLATHTKTEGSFKCIYCDKVFSHHILLMQHEKQHMVNGRHECTLCSMTYSNRNRLYLHIKSHLKMKDYICQYCGKEFLRYDCMMRHVVVSHGGHRIVCPICKKNLKGHLTEHMRTHEKKRPHVCPDCGQRFTQSTQLNVHRRAHTGARPYPCRICKRFFSHSNALMLHIRTHTGEKPFPCAMCPMSFSQLPHMKTHMRKIHGKEDPYKCFKCDSFFKLKAQLDVHANICTAGNNNLPVQGKKKKSKKGEEEIEVESPMSVSHMRFLLALLLTMIATKEKLKYLGFNKRLVDEILIESLEAMNQTPCKDEAVPPVRRLRTNIEMLLIKTVPKEQMDRFKKENKSTLDILELLTSEIDK